MTYRHYLLNTFGIDSEYTAIVNPDIKLEREKESEPFGEIVTDSKGRTILRVGQVLSKGPVLKVR